MEWLLSRLLMGKKEIWIVGRDNKGVRYGFDIWEFKNKLKKVTVIMISFYSAATVVTQNKYI